MDTALTYSAMPKRAELAMPEQSLTQWKKTQKRKLEAPLLWRSPIVFRLFTFGLMAMITLLAAFQIYEVVKVGGVTPLEWLFLLLFLVNFSWIALAFTSSIVGFLTLLKNTANAPLPVVKNLTQQTAIVMPIYNESPARVFGTMQAMIEAVQATGFGKHFDYFFLSDTTDPDIWIAEERTLLVLREKCPEAKIYYRHRMKNTARKAGNIADFVMGWGGNYAHMLVLDADSVMTGEIIVALAHEMENDADAGIIQTLPRLINKNSLLARLQQFAARIYGPIVAAGLSEWMGRSGNYWGHNAIIRMQAFAECGGLPHLKGKPPFGGHVLSHDFIEAAFIRRANYAVYMKPFWEGSYEESPPSLMDLAVRDRRWCQGNLQHSRIITAKGLHWATRQHLATGIMSYVASPLWLLQLLIGLALALQARFIRPEYFTHEFGAFPAWPIFDAEKAFNLFIFTMAVLLTPKFLGLIASLYDKTTRKAAGGGFKLVLSALFEILLSSLLAPVMMVIQSSSVVSIITGRDSGWSPQRRDDGTIPFKDVMRRHYRHVLLGVFGSIAAFSISPYIFAWMSPTLIGLLLAFPLSYYTASVAIGKYLKAKGILLIPEESAPPPIAEIAYQHGKAIEALQLEDIHAVNFLAENDAFRENHLNINQPLPTRKKGVIDNDKALAEAKLKDASKIDDLQSWLSKKEVVLALHDKAFIKRMMELENKA